METDQVVSEQITTAISINQPTKNMANRNLVKCPHCNSNVRNDRLQKHINKSHKPQKINRATPDKTITITVNNPPKIKSVPLKYGDGLNDVVSTNDRIDGSKDWHFFRDRGQFGSYSMFDPMDDESTS